MLSESVAQKPIMPVSEGTNTGQNAASESSFAGASSIGPSPPARRTTQASRASAITSTSGAAQFSKTRTAFMPR
jgi:hypothetical protein